MASYMRLLASLSNKRNVIPVFLVYFAVANCNYYFATDFADMFIRRYTVEIKQLTRSV